MTSRTLRERGLLGINRRNRDLIQRWNPRRAFPSVDDKIRTKELCEREGVATPKLLGVLATHSELRGLEALLEGLDAFVIKPAHGCQGNGILVVRERRGDVFVSASGRRLRLPDVRYRASEILSGLFSIAGQEDRALIEECLQIHPALDRFCRGGVPDIRVLAYRGLPVMAMVRLPTHRSGGRANLHHGAVGAGIDLSSGVIHSAVQQDRFLERHPDTGVHLIGVRIPSFERVLEQALRAVRGTELGYAGVDVVLDEERGPVVLEINARPGLSIQMANRAGLEPRLEEVDRLGGAGDRPVAERLALGRKLARDWGASA